MVRLVAVLASIFALAACSASSDTTSEAHSPTVSSTPHNITSNIERHLSSSGFVREYVRGNVTVIMGRDGGPETVRIAYPEGVLSCSADLAATG